MNKKQRIAIINQIEILVNHPDYETSIELKKKHNELLKKMGSEFRIATGELDEQIDEYAILDDIRAKDSSFDHQVVKLYETMKRQDKVAESLCMHGLDGLGKIKRMNIVRKVLIDNGMKNTSGKRPMPDDFPEKSQELKPFKLEKLYNVSRYKILEWKRELEQRSTVK